MEAQPRPKYENMIPPNLLEALSRESRRVEGCPGLMVNERLLKEKSPLETLEAQRFICTLYERCATELYKVLQQRVIDRALIDERTASYVEENQDLEYLSPNYKTVLGVRDPQGRLVVGPYPTDGKDESTRRVKVPSWLAGDQITLFGPPDTEKMSINAMNALHHKLPNEPQIVAELVESSGLVPRWGADSEDSKTPMMANLLKANENLKECYDGSLTFFDERKGKTYQINKEKRSLPVKRIPGLALPDGYHLYEGLPLPLHLYDFALHLYHNRQTPEALAFYIPKLENEEEARYLAHMIVQAEALLQSIETNYQLGSVKLFIVFENPRAIFRIREIADALYPYFVGGSLGWHDFLASTARLFKNDPRYQIPVKADPDIVIKHIRESHSILCEALKPMGGIAIGGMYGTLYEDHNQASFEVSMVGYIRDVCTQLKRGLDGFWVAHPNFVRVGIALVHAWRLYEKSLEGSELKALISALVPRESEREPLLRFVFGDDVLGLSQDHPLYQRGVLAADIETSEMIANSDDEEVRYNIFQALQYLTDWLCGNGCVALPARLKNSVGESIFVRVMDDLATTERSRWELWAELSHGRVSRETFERILSEEVEFIRAGQDGSTKKIQIHWRGEAARWYPIAIHCLRELVLNKDPVEFVPELILPLTYDLVREHDDPWAFLQSLKGDH